MGFRELQKFNDTLLAKQIWRLMSNQDSLFYRFFKEKLFPNRSILDAKENKGSYAWKSILNRCHVIRRGTKWRIGAGSSVSIYQDNQLLGPRHGRIISPISELTSEFIVSVLINQESCCWREAEIDRLFLPTEASTIKAIPFSFSSRSDVMFWPRNQDGIQSVKSGYKLLMETEIENCDPPNVSNSELMKSIWNGIWKLKVSNRIRMFMWRAGSDSLPTKVNLTKWKMMSETLCTYCKQGPEDTIHAL